MDEFYENNALEPIVQKKSHTFINNSFDKRYEKFSIKYNRNWKGKHYSNITIENYGSGQHGSPIRNAVTGMRYNYLVGSADEDLFFKVTDATGRNGRKDTLMLYYDTPEQFENHSFTDVSPEIKQRWLTKALSAQKRLGLI